MKMLLNQIYLGQVFCLHSTKKKQNPSIDCAVTYTPHSYANFLKKLSISEDGNHRYADLIDDKDQLSE